MIWTLAETLLVLPRVLGNRPAPDSKVHRAADQQMVEAADIHSPTDSTFPSRHTRHKLQKSLQADL